MVERFANNASTTLAAAIETTDGTSVTVDSYAAFPSSAQFRILIDSEIMLVTDGAGTDTWTVTRGAEDTVATTHLDEAVVTHILTAGALEQLKSDALIGAEATIQLVFISEAAGTELADGAQVWVEVPFDCEIEANTALADQSGSLVVDIWKDSYANYPPTDADSITAAAPVTITSATHSQDTTLSGWTKSLTVGDILVGNIDSCTDIEQATISLRVIKVTQTA